MGQFLYYFHILDRRHCLCGIHIPEMRKYPSSTYSYTWYLTWPMFYTFIPGSRQYNTSVSFKFPRVQCLFSVHIPGMRNASVLFITLECCRVSVLFKAQECGGSSDLIIFLESCSVSDQLIFLEWDIVSILLIFLEWDNASILIIFLEIGQGPLLPSYSCKGDTLLACLYSFIK